MRTSEDGANLHFFLVFENLQELNYLAIEIIEVTLCWHVATKLQYTIFSSQILQNN